MREKGAATLIFDTVIPIRTEGLTSGRAGEGTPQHWAYKWEGERGHSAAPGLQAHARLSTLVLELNPGLPVLLAWAFIAWLPPSILLLCLIWKQELKQRLWRRTTFGGDK